MSVVVWAAAIWASIWLQRHVANWSASWLPSFTPAGLPDMTMDASRDIGFSLVAMTPPMLPDVWVLVASIITVIALSKRDSQHPDSQGNKMINHLLFVGVSVWVFISQLSFLTTLPPSSPLCQSDIHPPYHASSLFAYSNSFRLSFHATYLTTMYLGWRTYHPGLKHSPYLRNFLIGAWLASLTSIIASRIDFTADVVRGALFAYVVFFFYTHTVVSNASGEEPAVLATGAESAHNGKEKAGSAACDVEASAPGADPPGVRLRRRTNSSRRATSAAKAIPVPLSPVEVNAEVARQRGIYLTLMRHALTNTLYGDEPLVVFDLADRSMFHRNGRYNWRTREAGLDLPSVAHCRSGGMRLQVLSSFIDNVLAARTPGDLIDMGVWRGGEAIYMRAHLLASNATDRHVVLVGPFRGSVELPKRLKSTLEMLCALLPPSFIVTLLSVISYFAPRVAPFPATQDVEGDEASTATNKAWLHFRLANPTIFERSGERTDLESVKDTFRRYDLLDRQVQFVTGDLQESLPGVPSCDIALLRLGMGLTNADVAQALFQLYPRISSGGYIMIDENAGCMTTINKFREERQIMDPLIWVDNQRIAWQKS